MPRKDKTEPCVSCGVLRVAGGSTGLCRECYLAKADTVAKRDRKCRVCEGLLYARNRSGICRTCRPGTAEVREASRKRALDQHADPERKAKHVAAMKVFGTVRTRERLAHIPPSMRELYTYLTRKQHMRAAEAQALVLEQFDKQRKGAK